ncbi:MAG TPA: hypothetical protein DEZ08_03855 [Dehalococcoidia bacterium]|jgi:hypothetical protein|nr:hypothetical protein [Dehalococcoidia bacterium]|tara:strand:- start:2447 stop:2728 length:282 start_codon:yes stop_codon:yes gene_type:complete
MDILIGVVLFGVAIAVVASPFIFGKPINYFDFGSISNSDISELDEQHQLIEVLELDYSLGNISQSDYRIQMFEYRNKIDKITKLINESKIVDE